MKIRQWIQQKKIDTVPSHVASAIEADQQHDDRKILASFLESKEVQSFQQVGYEVIKSNPLSKQYTGDNINKQTYKYLSGKKVIFHDIAVIMEI